VQTKTFVIFLSSSRNLFM